MTNKKLILPIAVIAVAGIAASLFYERPAASNFSNLQPILDQFAAPGMEHASPAICTTECHQEILEEWKNSHHGLANAPITEIDRERLNANEGSLLENRGMRWNLKPDAPVLSEDGPEDFPQMALPDYPVVGSIGITPLIQYLHLAEDGRIQTHDVAWDVNEKEWFSVFERDDDPEDPRVPGEWGHWSGQGMNWDANCAYCHMTEYEKKFDPVTNTYNRTWSHMAITCIQCHPKMNVHMDQIRNGNKEFKETLTPRQMMEYCATCHARRDQLTADKFVAGDVFEDHFQLTLNDIEGIYHPDGQVIGENYVYGSLTMSKMGHAGVTCMDCHDAHTTGFILPVENNALCQRCHETGLKTGDVEAPKIDPMAHSHHKADSTGNRCVECHMPHTYFMGRDPRRDHSFSHPDPRLNIELGIPDACTKCHQTEGVEWNLEYAEKWYGPDMNEERRIKAHLMQDIWDGADGAAERLKVAIRAEKNRYWKSSFISMLQYVPGDQEIFEILHEAVKDPEQMVRTTAIRLLGTANLGDAEKETLFNDPIRSVRLSAALSTPGMEGLSPELDKELVEYMTHTADSPMGSLRLASYYSSRGDNEKAIQLTKQAVEFEKLNPEAYRLAAIQLHTNGDTEGAFEHLNKALRIDANQPLVHFNMGLLFAEMNNQDKAISHLNQAILLQPDYEDAWYNLIVMYWQVNQIPTARTKLMEALKNLPNSQRLLQLARQMPPESN